MKLSLYYNNIVKENKLGEVIIDETNTLSAVIKLLVESCADVIMSEVGNYLVANTRNEKLKEVIKSVAIANNNYTLDVIDKEEIVSNITESLRIDSLDFIFYCGIGRIIDNISDYGIRIVMHSNEEVGHNKPHVHVVYRNEEVVYNIINQQTITAQLFRGKIDKIIVKYLQDNKHKLMDSWNLYTNGIKINTDLFEYEV